MRQSIQEWTFLKAAIHKIYLVHSEILCLLYTQIKIAPEKVNCYQTFCPLTSIEVFFL